jgi:hypothetical protein
MGASIRAAQDPGNSERGAFRPHNIHRLTNARSITNGKRTNVALSLLELKVWFNMFDLDDF